MEYRSEENGQESDDPTFSTTNLLAEDLEEQPDSLAQQQNERKTPLFTVEPAVFLIFFGWSLAGPVFTNLVVQQTCTELLGFNASDCQQLGTANESEYIQNLEQQVQPYTAKIILVRSLIEQIFPAICSFFLGPWSDKFGRKPLLYACYSGYCCVYLLLAGIAFASASAPLNPWLYILAYAPVMFSGGTCALITGVFCNLTDVTTEKNRAIRMGVMEGVLYAGLFVGSISSSYILQWTSAATVFAVSALSCLLGLLHIRLCVAETVFCPDFQGSKFRELFRFDHVRDMLVTSFKPRPDNRRAIIWLAIFGLVLSLAIMEGTATVFFLFTRAKFGWTIRDYTIYESVSIVVQLVGALCAIALLKKIFRMSDAMIAAVAFASDCLQNLARTLAVTPADLYFGVAVGVLKSISGPMGRAVISNVTPASEIGKVFSLVTALESVSPIGSAPLYTIIYTSTIDTFPSAFNAVSTGGVFLCFLTMMVAYVLHKGLPRVPYNNLEA
ncbi:probable peptidoglycan muropeptide transporter SLC46 [Phlebotomus argentipes]|uniref:probable peptidoglycan muropeptide transporter SLC46 n=1 Tax=Phlebotomus argentipes TaxID=94469 RepID=UPI00289353D0|nr:probable peptidoglycan muropeptide transporter SLC46 [Phlebotomus argentipes]